MRQSLGENNETTNVAIANALQLKAARCRASPIRFNYDVHANFKVAQPIDFRLIAFLLLTPYPTL